MPERPDLSLQQTQDADPASLTDAELTAALAWAQSLHNVWQTRYFALAVEKARRFSRQFDFFQHHTKEKAPHAPTHDTTLGDGSEQPHLPLLSPCPPDRPLG